MRRLYTDPVVSVADCIRRPWWYSYHTAVHDLSALNAAVERMPEDVLSHSFVPWKFHAKKQAFEPNLTEDRTYIHVISLEQVYAYDPLADIPESQQHLVVGGEVHMWAEQTDGVNLDNNLWPRVSAAGEVLWRARK